MTAREILAAIRSGLILSGKNTDGELEWIGNTRTWQEYHRLLADPDFPDPFKPSYV